MRKLVDAPRKKKQWTEKEEAYLQDKWGTVSITWPEIQGYP